jgi:hypothetical protein
MKNKKSVILGIIVAALALIGISSEILAGPPKPKGESEVNIQGDATAADTVRSGFSYQGRLTDEKETPLDGQYDMVFQFWDAPTDGKQMGSDIPANDVDVDNGLFNTTVNVPPEFFNGVAVWMRVKVDDEWLDPRREILPVPYALGLVPGVVVSGTTGGGGVIRGINASTTGWSNGVRGETNSPEGVGVLAINNAGGNAINAWSAATTGFSAGVFAESNSPDGSGVFGKNNATSGFAVGVHGYTDSPVGTGVRGASDTGGIGVCAHSSTGIGLHIRSISGTLILAYGSSDTDPEFYVIPIVY